MSTSKDKDGDMSTATSSSSVKSHFFDRSPSVSSREDRWPELLISRPDKSYYYTTKCKYEALIN